MPKLYFRYGAMAAAKTMNLLSVAESYRHQGKRALTIKPSLDAREKDGIIKSRSGNYEKAGLVVGPNEKIPHDSGKAFDVVLVDEVQFLSASQIDDLRIVARDAPVICYGLRADYLSNLFEGSRRLFEVADNIEEVKTTCHFCTKKGIMNLRLSREGPQILVGYEGYQPACWECWNKHMHKAT